jgi:hypothetical protein
MPGSQGSILIEACHCLSPLYFPVPSCGLLYPGQLDGA